MTFVGPHALKINRAQKMAETGPYRETFAAMLDAVPNMLIDVLSSARLAELIDAMAALATESKAIAARDICAEGAVWDSRQGRTREVAA